VAPFLSTICLPSPASTTTLHFNFCEITTSLLLLYFMLIKVDNIELRNKLIQNKKEWKDKWDKLKRWKV
jgi:hypothetical protein